MPYRRLPNTDQARLRSLHRALQKGEILDMYDLAFTQKTLVEIKSFLPLFEKALFEYKQAHELQVASNLKYQEKIKKARLYISHFIQVMNLAVIRGEVKAVNQELYGLEPNSKSVPDLSSDDALIHWGHKIIEGERQRISQGGTAIYSPSIANVKVHYDIFRDAYNKQKVLQNNTARYLENIAGLRNRADDIILTIWNEVEKHFTEVEDPEIRLQKCRDYGLIYYYRKGEKIENE
ncbi:hypothetical protein [Saccharicrinis sp. FJH54]|uniref:hypothetical protein n=1 Tax=Saccharicrinis sp. FJH54 TaxID=3344665 RepID=UPI0035D4CA45